MEHETPEVYKDLLKDAKDQRRFNRIIIMLLIGLLALSIGGIFWMNVHCQNMVQQMAKDNQIIVKDLSIQTTDRFVEFVNQFDVYSTVELITDGESENSGGINISR